MKEDGPIFKIASTYCLKAILSYIEYNTILKLVKYNKCLQKKLDISIKDYSLDYEIEKKKDTKTNYFDITDCYVFYKIIYCLFTVCLYFYEIVFAIIYICKKPYEDKKEIENIEKYFQESFGKSTIYDKILECEIYYLSFTITIGFLYFLCLCGCCLKKLKKNFISYISGYAGSIQPILFGIYFWLLRKAYLINENPKYHWVILNLFLLVIFIFVCLILTLALFIIYKFKYFSCYETFKIIYIKKFQGIEINTLEIDNYFDKMNSEEKKNYILSKTEKMTFKKNKNKDSIILIKSKINKYRKENKLDKLEYIDSLPEFIIHGNSLVKFTLNNIFKIGKKKYLFKYPSGEFLNLLNKKNKNILDILSLDYLNKIKIIIKEDNEYILVYDDRNDEHSEVSSNISFSERVHLNIQSKFKINSNKNEINKNK